MKTRKASTAPPKAAAEKWERSRDTVVGVGYEVLVTVALVLHFGFLAYLAVGGFVAWRWPRTIWLHLATATWGVLVVAASLTCPLTTLEHWARRQAGQAVSDAGFIERYLTGVIYPEDYMWVARVVLALVVGVSWAGVVIRHRRAARRQQDHDQERPGVRA